MRGARLVREVASAYFNLRQLDQELEIARRTLAARLESLRLVTEIPFDSQRKAMSVVMAESNGNRWMYTKGAPEVVLRNPEARKYYFGEGMELTPAASPSRRSWGLRTRRRAADSEDEFAINS